MNPALPYLAGILALGGWWGRRTWGLPWIAIGVAAAAVLWPTLVLPDGVPSPAADLAHHAPWSTDVTPAGGNPALQDVTYQVQPWLLFQRDELRAGRLPEWNPYQYAGTPHWANGSSAPLFPLHLLFVVLPLSVAWTIVAWCRIVIAGMGAYALARALGVSRSGSTLAGVSFALAGIPVGFLLFPMGSAMALAPWVLLAVERHAAGAGRATTIGVAAGLQLLAGHPGTSVHTAVATGLYLAARLVVADRRLSAGVVLPMLRLTGAWFIGVALAAVHVLPFLAYLPETSRWAEVRSAGAIVPVEILASAFLRFVLPDLFGQPADGTWFGPFNYLATAFYFGVVTLALAASGVVGALRGGDGRWRAVTVMAAGACVLAFPWPVIGDLLSRVPAWSAVPAHRIAFLLVLGLSLLGGRGLDRWRAGQGRASRLAAGGAIAAAAVIAWAVFLPDWSRVGLVPDHAWRSLFVVAAIALLCLPRLGRLPAMAVVALVVADLVVAHAPINPGLSSARQYPVTPAIAFVQAAGGRVAATGNTLRPNTPMAYRVRSVTGDDSVRPRGVTAWQREQFGSDHPTFFSPIETWTPDALRWLGVRWIMTAPGAAPPIGGWTLAHDGADARVWQNPEPAVEAHWLGLGDATVRLERLAPGRLRVEWTAASNGTIAIAETHLPGWSSDAAGVVGVDEGGGRWLGLPVRAGTGVATLEYQAPGLMMGAVVSAAAWLLSVGVPIARGRGRRARVSAGRSPPL